MRTVRNTVAAAIAVALKSVVEEDCRACELTDEELGQVADAALAALGANELRSLLWKAGYTTVPKNDVPFAEMVPMNPVPANVVGGSLPAPADNYVSAEEESAIRAAVSPADLTMGR